MVRTSAARRPLRLAFIVSHPIQYYVPLYRRLALRDDVVTRVFYTWHAGGREVWDCGFKKKVAWDIMLSDGYDYELVPNRARDPGTHHFWGLRNPGLVETVMAWRPDAVHLTGYAYASHLSALRGLQRCGVPVLFRGDSHLLDSRPAWKALARKVILSRLFGYPAAFLYVGMNNRNYYRAYGVPESKLFSCPHSIEFDRFADPAEKLEREALEWRHSLGLGDDKVVLLFAGKFEQKKQPVALMKAVADMKREDTILLMVGGGELGEPVREMVRRHPQLFKVLPFQNQSRMPVVYRLGDLFILPSAYDETWGLAVNEAMACGRAVLLSDHVGCAPDMVSPGANGEIFRAADWQDFRQKLSLLIRSRDTLRRMGRAARETASRFRIEATEAGLMRALAAVTGSVCAQSVGRIDP